MIQSLGQETDAFWNYKRERAWLFWDEERDFTIVGFRELLRLCIYVSPFSRVRLCETLWTTACQTLLSLSFSRQEYWSGLPNPPPRDLPDPGTEYMSLMSPSFVGMFFTLGASLVLLWLRLPAPGAGAPGSIPGQGTSSCMPQLRVRVLQLKVPHAATKTQHSQINNCFLKKVLIATITLSLNVGITLVSARYLLSKRCGGLGNVKRISVYVFISYSCEDRGSFSRIISRLTCIFWASQVVPVVKNPPANARDMRDTGSIPGSGRSPGGGHGNPLQYSCLVNPRQEEEPGGLQSMRSHRVGGD